MEATERRHLFAILRDIAFIGAIYVYYTGWIYVRFYFGHFGLSPEHVNVQYHSVFVYSSNALLQPYALVNKVVGVLALVVCGVLIWWRPTWRLAVLGTVLVLMFPFLAGLAYTAATELARERLQNDHFARVSFLLREDAQLEGQLGDEFISANRTGRLRLLHQALDAYYVYPHPVAADRTNDVQVFRIHSSDIVLTRTRSAEPGRGRSPQ